MSLASLAEHMLMHAWVHHRAEGPPRSKQRSRGRCQAEEGLQQSVVAAQRVQVWHAVRQLQVLLVAAVGRASAG